MRRCSLLWLIGLVLASCGETKYEREKHGENDRWERTKTLKKDWLSRHADVVAFEDQFRKSLFRKSLTIEVQDSIVANADKRFWIETLYGGFDLHRHGGKYIITNFSRNDDLITIECTADEAARLVSSRNLASRAEESIPPDFIFVFTLTSATPLSSFSHHAETEGSGEYISAHVVMEGISGTQFTGTLIDFVALDE